MANCPTRTNGFSPYSSPPVALHFGLNRQPYYLPKLLLHKLENLPSRDSWTGEIHIADVDADIGHVLIHYLHTDAYQTLNNIKIEDTEDCDTEIVRNEFQKAVLALIAATKYGLPGLQELAQVEMERRGKDMGLYDVVRATKEDFIVGSSHVHVWVREYVLEKVRQVFGYDPDVFSKSDFFESIESPTLTKLMAQMVVSLYSEEVFKLRKGGKVNGNASSPERSEKKGEVILDTFVESNKEGPFPSTVPSSHAEPPVMSTDPAVAVVEDAVEPWDSSGEALAKKDKTRSILPPDTPPPPFSPLPAPEPEAEPVIAVPLRDPFAGLSEVEEKMLKKRMQEQAGAKERGDAQREPEEEKAEAEAESQRTIDAGPEKLEEKDAITAAAVTITTIAEIPAVDPFAGLSRKQKMKLEKKMKAVAGAREVEAAERKKSEQGQIVQPEPTITGPIDEHVPNFPHVAPVGQVYVPNGSWGATSIEMGIERKQRAESDGILPEPETAVGTDLIDGEPAVSVDEASTLISTTEMGATPFGDDCPLRYEHLSRSDGWKACEPCELYMRRLALKLHSAGLPDVNGFNASE